MNNFYYRILMCCLTATLIMGSCSDQIEFEEKTSSDCILRLSASYPSATRASDSGFEDGDAMGLYVLDYSGEIIQSMDDPEVHAANTRFNFHGEDNSWQGTRDIYWSSSNTPADIIAYYPYSTNIDNPEQYSFSVNRNQQLEKSNSTLDGYESSDLLWGCVRKQMPTADKVNITLNHIMAGIRITLAKGNGFSDNEWSSLTKQAVIQNTILKGSVNLSDGSATIGNNEAEQIIPLEYNGDFRAVVFPQTVQAGKKLISLSIGNDGYSLVKQESISYEAGKMHTFTITVDKKENGDFNFSLTDEGIIPWIDDAEFRDGIIRSYTTVNVPQRGTLKEEIARLKLNYKILTNLKLTGEIDETDFYFMRDEMSSLKALNLKDVDVYYEDRKDVIPYRAMYCKTTLSKIIFPKNLKVIGSDAFHRTGLMGDLIIPEGVEKIGETFDDYSAFGVGSHSNGDMGAFGYCQNLLGTLELPSTLTHIEHGAFDYCEFEGNLFLPDGLEFIGAYAFYKNNFTGALSLPSSLTYIGNGAFAATQFTGNLEIPEKITIIRKNTFQDTNLSGNLMLPAGLQEIQEYAFSSSPIRGELLLPSSVRVLGNYAFSNTRISNIVFSENLSNIGNGCFMNCYHLSGKLVIPKNVTRINEYTFSSNQMLSEIELHENVSYIAGAAFANDYNISEIKVLNSVPPIIGIVTENEGGYTQWGDPTELVEKNPFYGVALSNVTLKVPDGSRDTYARAEIWKNFGRHATENGFGCRPEKVCALNNSHQETIIIDGNGEWEVSHIPSWCKLSATSGKDKTQVVLTINELSKGSGERNDYVEFRIKGSDFTARCDISQVDYKYNEDECITLQKATRGKGIDILFVADGFDAQSISNDEYMNLVNVQIEAFFGIEPYSTYKDYFNVYACISLSQENGVSTTSTKKNTKFSTRFDNGTGCSDKTLACNNPDDVFDYAVTYSPLKYDKLNQSLIIMSLNSDQYGSVTTLTENGSAIAIVGMSSDPYPWDTRGMLQHEACGHAFGKLAEERITENNYLPENHKTKIQEFQWKGWYQNISLSGKMNEVPWSTLIFDPRYSDKVDVFEGAYGWTRGVYRAEINSCMNYGIPYFSAAARMDIMRRILEYSGEEFNMEKFYATDSDKWGATGNSTRAAIPSEADAYVNSGLHHPVRIVKSRY